MVTVLMKMLELVQLRLFNWKEWECIRYLHCWEIEGTPPLTQSTVSRILGSSVIVPQLVFRRVDKPD